MSIFKRRSSNTSRDGTAASSAPARTSSYQELLWSRWQALPARDQLALSVLLMFLLLFIGGFGGYTLQQAATNSKTEYQQQVTYYFWLRAQASNIDSSALTTDNNNTAQPAASRVSALLNGSGITDAQVVAAGESVQLSFANNSQSIVSSALGQLEQQGWQFNQLTMQQDRTTKQIQVQATIVN